MTTPIIIIPAPEPEPAVDVAAIVEAAVEAAVEAVAEVAELSEIDAVVAGCCEHCTAYAARLDALETVAVDTAIDAAIAEEEAAEIVEEVAVEAETMPAPPVVEKAAPEPVGEPEAKPKSGRGSMSKSWFGLRA